MRKEIIGNATLYLGDCLEILPTLPKVDAVITDPPYGIGFRYESHDDDPKSYIAWMSNIADLSEAILHDSGICFFFQAMPNCRQFHKIFGEERKWRIFAAAKNFVQMRPTAMQYSFDPCVVWWRDGEEKPYSLGTASRDFHLANTAPVVANPNNPEKKHPCPRPLDQMTHIVGQWVKPDGSVLDPFMGSGTTGVACMNLGRKFIGIEIEEKYFDIACERIRAAQAQGRLFA